MRKEVAGRILEKPVVVLGAGLAGLVAALELSEHGIPIIVLERDAVPGGRLSPRRESADSIPLVDPVFSSNHGHLLGLLQRLGADAVVERIPPAQWIEARSGSVSHPRGNWSGVIGRADAALRSLARLGARKPLEGAVLRHALRGLYASGLERLDVIPFGIRSSAEAHPFVRHLHAHLDPYTLNALTIPEGQVSSRTIATVMHSTLRQASVEWYRFTHGPFRGLIEPLRTILLARGVDILTERPVEEILAGDIRVEGVRAGGDVVEASYVISTLPPHALAGAVGDLMGRYRYFRNLGQLRSVLQATLVFEVREGGEHIPKHGACLDSVPRLSFHHLPPSANVGPREKRLRLHCTAHQVEATIALSDDAFVERIRRALVSHIPGLRLEALRLLHVNRSTTSRRLGHEVGSWSLRPPSRSPLFNLLVAGDWVRHQADLACLEGAVCSAENAVRHILRDLGMTITPSGSARARPGRAAAIVGTLARRVRLSGIPDIKAAKRYDKRLGARVECAIEGYLEDREVHVGWSRMLVVNLTPDGVFFVSDAHPRRGARVRLRLKVPAGGEIELRGRVLRVEPSTTFVGGANGIACRVRPRDEESLYRWDALRSDVLGSEVMEP